MFGVIFNDETYDGYANIIVLDDVVDSGPNPYENFEADVTLNYDSGYKKVESSTMTDCETQGIKVSVNKEPYDYGYNFCHLDSTKSTLITWAATVLGFGVQAVAKVSLVAAAGTSGASMLIWGLATLADCSIAFLEYKFTAESLTWPGSYED
jgi:hypothetical protein